LLADATRFAALKLKSAVSASDHESADRVDDQLKRLVEETGCGLGGTPSVPELLKILVQSVPTSDDRLVLKVLPVRLRGLRGDGTELPARPSRIGLLNDAPFVLAADLFATLLDPRTAGVAGSQLADLIAIPSSLGGNYLALIVARNRFGTAFGLFKGRRANTRVPRLDDHVNPYPVYCDERRVRDGSWPIVTHADQLRSLFAAEPEIFHMVGVAERADGTMRDVPDDEADRLGLRDGTYRQVHMSTFLPDELDRYGGDGGLAT
jgi:hypothetical protein